MTSPVPVTPVKEEPAAMGSKEPSPVTSDGELEPSGGCEESQVCPLCQEAYKQPRILSCLHVFCTACLEKQLEESSDELEPEEMSSKSTESGMLRCMHCHQDTSMPGGGVAALPLDSILVGQMSEASGVEDLQIVCTSCKAREKAVARCMDCANFLCPNCVTAHQYMRCFENHKVGII